MLQLGVDQRQVLHGHGHVRIVGAGQLFHDRQRAAVGGRRIPRLVQAFVRLAEPAEGDGHVEALRPADALLQRQHPPVDGNRFGPPVGLGQRGPQLAEPDRSPPRARPPARPARVPGGPRPRPRHSGRPARGFHSGWPGPGAEFARPPAPGGQDPANRKGHSVHGPNDTRWAVLKARRHGFAKRTALRDRLAGT